MKPAAKRWLGRLAVSGAGPMLIVALLTGYGWRYGFTPLPDPVEGCRSEPLPTLPWSQITTNNVWYWFRELDRALALASSENRLRGIRTRPSGAPWNRPSPWTPIVEIWSHTGSLPTEAADRVHAWLERDASLARTLEGALRCSDSRAPSPADPVMPERVLLLSHYALLLAATHETEGRSLDALRALIDVWRLQAHLAASEELAGLFDERGPDQLNAWVARPWRRVAITAPSLPAPELRRLLDSLDTVTDALAPLELSYRQQWVAGPSDGTKDGPNDWSRVRSAFRVAGLRLRQEFGRVVSGLLERLVGGRRPAPLQAEGVRHLARPLAEFIAALQRTAARPEDLRRIREARFSHGLAELLRRGPYAEPEDRVAARPDSKGKDLAQPVPARPVSNHSASSRLTAPNYPVWPQPDRWSWWRRAVDRPAVWRYARNLPTGAAMHAKRSQWLVLFESCRLTLALRAYRDQHGHWPSQLEDLVPSLLPALPLDPFSGAPFGYEQTGDGWTFWSWGTTGRRPTPEEAQAPPQRLFWSSEFDRP